MIRVLIISDIRLYLEGLAEVIGRQDQIEVIGTCETMREAMSAAVDTLPDVVLMDMAMGDSLGAVTALKRLAPATKVVALGVPELEPEVIACAQAGVSNFVTRKATIADLIRAVSDTVRGELRCSPKVAASLFRRVGMMAADRSAPDAHFRMTPRELEIVHLIDLGLSNKEIATRLCIEVSTVKNHVHNVLEKLNVSRRGEAAAMLRPLLTHLSARHSHIDQRV